MNRAKIDASVREALSGLVEELLAYEVPQTDTYPNGEYGFTEETELYRAVKVLAEHPDTEPRWAKELREQIAAWDAPNTEAAE